MLFSRAGGKTSSGAISGFFNESGKPLVADLDSVDIKGFEENPHPGPLHRLTFIVAQKKDAVGNIDHLDAVRADYHLLWRSLW